MSISALPFRARQRLLMLVAAICLLVAALAIAPKATAVDLGGITGTVSDIGGAGLRSAVLVADSTGTQVASVTTAADGSYTVSGLPTGNYLVRFTAKGYITHWYGGDETQGSAMQIAVTAGQSTTASATLQTGGTITGQVTSNGTPSPAKVTAYYRNDAGQWVPDTNALSSNTGGTYTVRVSTAQPVKLAVVAGYSVWYGDAFTDQNAAPVQVDPGQTHSGADIALPGSATLVGRITNDFGAPVTGAVRAYVVDHGQLISLNTAWSSQDSGYSIVVPAVHITLKAGISTFVSDQQWSDTWLGNTADAAAATFLDPAAGQTIYGQNIAVIGGSTYTGVVTDDNGLPVPGVTVTAYRSATAYAQDTTDTSGAFHLTGLSECAFGAVTVKFSGDGLVEEWYKNATTQADAALVGNVCGMDRVMDPTVVEFAPGRQLTNVTAPTITGQAVPGHWLTAEGDTWNFTPDSVSYQWYCDGQPMGPGTGRQRTFPVDVTTGCSTLSVRALAEKALYSSAVATSPPVSVTPLGATSAPVVSGAAVAGHALCSQHATWTTPPAQVTTTQWLRNGSPIPGATGSCYRLTSSDVGKPVSAREVGTWDVFGIPHQETSTSDPTDPVKAQATLRVAATGRAGKANMTVKIATPGSTAPGGTVAVRAGTKVVRKIRVGTTPHTWTFTIRITRGWHTFTATYTGSAWAVPTASHVRIFVH